MLFRSIKRPGLVKHRASTQASELTWGISGTSSGFKNKMAAADRDDVKHWVTYTGKNGPNNFSVNAMRSRNCLSFLILENDDWFL